MAIIHILTGEKPQKYTFKLFSKISAKFNMLLKNRYMFLTTILSDLSLAQH